MFVSIDKPGTLLKLEVKKSRFFGFCYMVESEDGAKAMINELVSVYSDATHVCYAYVCGSVMRFSDAGEPSGTAGMPILNAIKARGLDHALVVVVRYFGGVKLGAGGLMRAYRECAVSTLDEAGLAEYESCSVYDAVVPSEYISNFNSTLTAQNASLSIKEYGALSVRLIVSLRTGEKLPDYCTNITFLEQGYQKVAKKE